MPHTQRSEAATTWPQRIGESTSGLLRESLKLPSPRTTTGVLATLNTENAKASSSFSSTATREFPLVLRPSSQYAQSTPDQYESFRSIEQDMKIGRPYGQVAFDDFLVGQSKSKHEAGFALSGDRQGRVSVGIAEDITDRVEERDKWKMQDENQDLKDRNNDGSAVVALLSDPSFTVDEEPGGTLELESDKAGAGSHESLQRGKRPVNIADVLNLLNHSDLLPDFGAPWDSHHGFSATKRADHGRGHVARSGFGDVQPWIDILDRYHDEVWGEMLPLVHNAREEIKAANENQTCLERGPAVRRLKMVLQHLDDFKY